MTSRSSRIVLCKAGRARWAVAVLCTAAIVLVVSIFFREWPRSATSDPAPQSSGAVAQIYYCPMHPTYTSDHPGNCPICNMTLVLRTGAATASESSVEGHATVALDDARRQLIGVRTGLVRREKIEQHLRAVGRIEYDEHRLSAVNPKVGGWVDDLFVKSTGDEVKKGDPLFALYSPELIEAQRNYLLAARSAAHSESIDKSIGDSTLRAARERLLLLDQDPDRIAELVTAGEAPHATTFRAKSDGVVVRRNIVQGGRVEAGADLYQLADVSSVWVVAEFYEYELPLVHAGQAASIELSSQPGEPLHGEVAYVYPYLESNSRTASVRVEVPNADRRLKPGMFATVFLSADFGEQLVIDDQAVLDTGERQLVFVDLGDGRLEPRAVGVGAQVGDLRVVLSGLAEGDRVVTSGNFLVDSESRLKSALVTGTRAMKDEHAGHKR